MRLPGVASLTKTQHWQRDLLGIPPGHLIVDSAAGQELTGEAACVTWEQMLSDAGLRGVWVHCKMMTPKGVGVTAHPTRTMMMPTMTDGLPGVLQYTVVEEDIPGLLPLSFQEKQGAMINLRTNKLLHVSEQSFPCIAHQGATAR